jgi:hypothetical protein
MIARLLAAAMLAVLLAACGSNIRREPARLRLVLEPRTARVFVDDRFRATGRVLHVRPLELAPGVHVLTIEAEGHFPHDLRVDLPEGDTTIEVTLRPVPP